MNMMKQKIGLQLLWLGLTLNGIVLLSIQQSDLKLKSLFEDGLFFVQYRLVPFKIFLYVSSKFNNSYFVHHV